MPSDQPYAHRLSRHVLFARSLALVSSAAIGIAAGATVFGASGCEMGCVGVCNPQPWVHDGGDAESPPDRDAGDAGATDATDDAGAGGGPLGAPPMPPAWIA